MTASDIQCRLEAYLELRRSLGFVVCYGAYALKELLQYVQAKGLSWPIHSQTVLDWIAAAHCGPAGRRARLIHARGFLRHLKASFPETEVPPPGILAPVIPPNRTSTLHRKQPACSRLHIGCGPPVLCSSSPPTR